MPRANRYFLPDHVWHITLYTTIYRSDHGLFWFFYINRGLSTFIQLFFKLPIYPIRAGNLV